MIDEIQLEFNSLESLSARRAWIEIYNLSDLDDKFSVALRKESVDRNFSSLVALSVSLASLSARRAWIEMLFYCFSSLCNIVALRKESVDRNNTHRSQCSD